MGITVKDDPASGGQKIQVRNINIIHKHNSVYLKILNMSLLHLRNLCVCVCVGKKYKILIYRDWGIKFVPYCQNFGNLYAIACLLGFWKKAEHGVCALLPVFWESVHYCLSKNESVHYCWNLWKTTLYTIAMAILCRFRVHWKFWLWAGGANFFVLDA